MRVTRQLSRMEARDELSEFIDEYLSYLSEKYKVPKVKWRFVMRTPPTLQGFWGAFFSWFEGLIGVHRRHIRHYIDFPEGVLAIMKYELAHEFYHYLRFLALRLSERGIPKRVWYGISQWGTRAGEEERAHEFAATETGIDYFSFLMGQAIYLGV